MVFLLWARKGAFTPKEDKVAHGSFSHHYAGRAGRLWRGLFGQTSGYGNRLRAEEDAQERLGQDG